MERTAMRSFGVEPVDQLLEGLAGPGPQPQQELVVDGHHPAVLAGGGADDVIVPGAMSV
jgi:hypothetical protein